MCMEKGTEESEDYLQKQLVKSQPFNIFCYKEYKKFSWKKFIIFLQKEREKEKGKKKKRKSNKEKEEKIKRRKKREKENEKKKKNIKKKKK